MLTGILNIDKPAEISSAGVVTRVKHLLPRWTKVGHAGTLDPFATGVLLVLVGKATKLSNALMGQPKQYDATLKLGATTETDDLDSAESPTPGVAEISRATIDAALPRFVGAILQQPPVYSALKINGRRACDRVRDGQTVELKPRPVIVYGIEVLDYHWPILRLRIDCGRGTYIRSIARELGEALQTGAYLTALRRTAVGIYRVEQAITLEQLAEERVEKHLGHGPV